MFSLRIYLYFQNGRIETTHADPALIIGMHSVFFVHDMMKLHVLQLKNPLTTTLQINVEILVQIPP
jgi:hypothetical protein